MGAFEFDVRNDLCARNCCCSNEETNNGSGEVCIIAQKIFDQCRIQKCLTSDILGPARAASNALPNCNEMLCEGDIIVPPCNASDVTMKHLKLSRIEILRKTENTLQDGCWDVELKYVFDYTLEFRRADGCIIGCIDATNAYILRVTLFGDTESNVTTTNDLYPLGGNTSGGPYVIAEGKAIALGADLKYPCASYGCGCNSCCCGTNAGDVTMGAPVAVNVTIGLFTIVKMFRTVNMIVESLGRCVPETCTSIGNACDPCANFDSLAFPLDAFSPVTEPRSCCGYGTTYGSPNCQVTSHHDCGCSHDHSCGCSCNCNCGCNDCGCN
ncbi:hypothetical protein [Chakrabartyella piscis]|uniref:hypothetical protein n=1 Tax=Chakrabartyella piscis TaxID=2918914 RepID=UPI00295863DF|nr:hypothetical protein [Chakrabartyella piscis]